MGWGASSARAAAISLVSGAGSEAARMLDRDFAASIAVSSCRSCECIDMRGTSRGDHEHMQEMGRPDPCEITGACKQGAPWRCTTQR